MLGIHRQGAYAEFSVVLASTVYPMSDEVDLVDAAALTVNGPLAQAQLDEAGVGPGTWVLVQAGGSASGTMAVASALRRGVRVVATSRQAWKRDRLVQMGAILAADGTADDFVDSVLDLTEGVGVYVVVDNIGDPVMWANSMAVLAVGGTAVTSGAFAGGRVNLDLRPFYLRSQRVIGIRTANGSAIRRLWSEVAAGLRPVVDETFPLEDAPSAHEKIEANRNFGRVLLTVG